MWIKDLACPEQDDHFGISDILYVMGVSRWDIDDLDVGIVDIVVDHVAAVHMAKPNRRVALNHTELLDFAVVIVVPTGHAGVGC